MSLDDLINTFSPNVALQFSGGRDSLAMLLLLQPYLDRVTVYYTNSGDAYPETLALAHAVRDSVPSFVEIAGRVNEVRAQHGFCSDLVPSGSTWQFGAQQIKGHLPLIDRYSCCYKAILEPMHERMRADGIKLILRGQRDTDEPRSHVRNGETVDGFTIAYPISDWTTDQVEAHIVARGMQVPPYYAEGATSAPDCMHCTAWLEHNSIQYLAKHHPEVAKTVNTRLKQIKVSVESFSRNLDATLEKLNA